MLFKLFQSFLKRFITLRTFMFNDVVLHYFYHSYNTVEKERAIEVPIIRWYLNNQKGKRILEIGNVTKHYYDLFRDVERDVVDRDEEAYDVFNQDIYGFRPGYKYDFIFSISTFEHMGERTFSNLSYVLEELLDIEGMMVLTFPMGFSGERVDISAFYIALNHYLKYYDVECFFFRRRGRLSWVKETGPEGGCIGIMEIKK